MRSPGAPQVAFAVESHIDMIAHELRLDPLEFRRRNAHRGRRPDAVGRPAAPYAVPGDDRRGRARLRLGQAKAPGVGRGVSIYEHPSGSSGRSTVTPHHEARTAGSRSCSVRPIRARGFHTIAAQLVAEHFGLSMTEVEVVQGDTLATDFEVGAGGSGSR